jgi:hypothetical protein
MVSSDASVDEASQAWIQRLRTTAVRSFRSGSRLSDWRERSVALAVERAETANPGVFGRRSKGDFRTLEAKVICPSKSLTQLR